VMRSDGGNLGELMSVHTLCGGVGFVAHLVLSTVGGVRQRKQATNAANRSADPRRTMPP
jgi:hypothetical protein